MSLPAPIRQRRARILVGLLAACALCVAALALGAMLDRPVIENHPRTGAPVLSGVSKLEAAARIDVRLADERYALVKADGGWRMDSAAGFPVRPGRIGELLSGLAEMSWGAAKTRDRRKLDRISLSDPDDEGTGAKLQVLDANGVVICDLIVGRRDGRLYARNTGETLSFAMDGDLPALQTRQAWLDFDVIAILPEAIEGVVIAAPSGERLHLTRDASGGPRDFVPGPAHPDVRLVSRLAAATPALALSRFAPLNVIPATNLTTDPVGRHITLTQDGLEIIVDAYREPEGYFLTARAVEAAEGARRAEDINSRARGWAFEVSRFDWSDYTPEISDIVEPGGGNRTQRR